MDINKFWNNLLGNKLISPKLLNQMLRVQSHSESEYYGYGMWLSKVDASTYTPFFQGCDPGVSFVSGYDTVNGISITAVSNFGCNVWRLRRNIIDAIKESFSL